jgi:hypothetical protein
VIRIPKSFIKGKDWFMLREVTKSMKQVIYLK